MHEIIGQDRAVGMLNRALQTGRVHHAYIFHGPAGVGKFTTACAWARVYLCHSRQTDLAGRMEACGACASCRLWNRYHGVEDATEVAHPDFRVLRKELAAVSDNATLRKRKQMNLPVDLLREHMLGGTTSNDKDHSPVVYQTARLGHGKVFVIDEAELLDRHGQNALLKTLEEPPAGTCIILVTSQEDQLLMTIRSRCQRVAFDRLSDEFVGRWLDTHLAPNSEDQRTELISVAEGSLGRAKLAVEYGLAQWADLVAQGLMRMQRGNCPVEMGSQMAQMMDAFAGTWVEKRPNASKEAANHQAAQLMLSLIGAYARRRVSDEAGQIVGGDVGAGESWLGPWVEVIEAVDRAWSEIDANVNLGLACDHLVSLLWSVLAPRSPLSAP